MLVQLPLDPRQSGGGLLLHEGLLAAAILLVGAAAVQGLIKGLIAVDMPGIDDHILQLHFNVIPIL